MSPALRTEHYDADRNGSFGEPTWLGTQHRKDSFRELLQGLPDEIKRARDRGLPIYFLEADLPDEPDTRAAALALLEVLGVELVTSA